MWHWVKVKVFKWSAAEGRRLAVRMVFTSLSLLGEHVLDLHRAVRWIWLHSPSLSALWSSVCSEPRAAPSTVSAANVTSRRRSRSQSRLEDFRFYLRVCCGLTQCGKTITAKNNKISEEYQRRNCYIVYCIFFISFNILSVFIYLFFNGSYAITLPAERIYAFMHYGCIYECSCD